MNPKHTNPTKTGRIAHAPYNFVPLPEKAIPAPTPLPSHDQYDSDWYTGYLDCALITKSPVYTRAAMDPDFFASKIQKMMQDRPAREKYAEFFHLDDAQRPVIPGSTLRGMTRTLIEIAGYSEIKWVTEEPLIFRAVGDTSSLGKYYRNKFLFEDTRSGRNYFVPKVHAGYMRYIRGNWYIQPAKELHGVTFARIHHDKIPEDLPRWHHSRNASRIWVKLGKYEYQPVRGGFIHLKYLPVTEALSTPQEGYQEAVLAQSGPMNKKAREAVIFPPNEDERLISIDDNLVALYREQVTQAQQDLLGRDGVLKDWQPVFYLLEKNRLVFFGHTWLFRIPYDRSPYDLLPARLKDESVRDLAEAMFGFVDSTKTNQKGYAGRVFFTDAIAESNQFNLWVSEKPQTPKILSGPKPTTFQHYLTQQQPDPVVVGKTRDKKPKFALKLDHYASPPPHPTTLRGHKLYWHKGPHPDYTEKTSVNWEKDSQHTQIKPVRPGVTFHFRVYFENLSKEELGALLWVLDLPQGHYHKIGMGKPLGLGAVEIKPRLILTDRQDRYRRLFSQNTWHEAAHEESDVASFKQAFEAYVLKNMDSTERGKAKSLSDVERIQHLLKMLEWPGPSPELTEYMDIEEFRHRPVLPDPLHIQPEANKGKKASRKPKTPQRKKVSKPKPPTAEQKPKVLQNAQDAREGMIVRGVIEKAETSRFVVVIEKNVPGSLTFGKAHLQDISADTAKSYVGMKVIAKIKRINKKGNIQLEALQWE